MHSDKTLVGAAVGEKVGAGVGSVVGCCVGLLVGTVGAALGAAVGFRVGCVGAIEGETVEMCHDNMQSMQMQKEQTKLTGGCSGG